MRPRVVSFQLEIIVGKVEHTFYIRVQYHTWQGARRTFQLQAYLLQVIPVDMCVSQGVYEIAGLQSGHLCHHLEQQGIRCDIERNAEKRVRASLVQLKAKPSLSHVKLEKGMAGWQIHPFQITHVPCADDDASRVRGVPYGVYGFLNLVDETALIVGP